MQTATEYRKILMAEARVEALREHRAEMATYSWEPYNALGVVDRALAAAEAEVAALREGGATRADGVR